MRITLFRLNDDVSMTTNVLRRAGDYAEVATSAPAGVELKLFVKGGPGRPAKWVSELAALTANPSDLDGLRAASSSAVLLARAGGPVFAICFGGGFHGVDPARYIRGFGVRVTANAIEGNRVKSADTRGLNRSGRSQKVILPVASALEDLGIEPTEEWVRQLSGPARSPDFASTASGADSLKLSIKDFSLHDIGPKLKAIEEYYQSSEYQEQFAFLDRFVKLDPADPAVPELDAHVVGLVFAGSPDIAYADPDPFDRPPADRYQVQYRRQVTVDDLDPDLIHAALDQLPRPPADPLRRIRILALDVDDNEIGDYPLRDYIQAEIPTDDARFILTAGVWFRVADNYIAEVNDALAGLSDLTDTLNLPAWDRRADGDAYIDEGTYNEQAAAASGYALLDKANLTLGPRQTIEICDLATTDKHLICVKRANRSSTLSHLFAQGMVSASLMHENAYQQQVLDALAPLTDSPTTWGASSDWTIVFAIGTTKPGPLLDSLFFFTQVHLEHAVRQIRSRNIKVAIAKITQ